MKEISPKFVICSCCTFCHIEPKHPTEFKKRLDSSLVLSHFAQNDNFLLSLRDFRKAKIVAIHDFIFAIKFSTKFKLVDFTSCYRTRNSFFATRKTATLETLRQVLRTFLAMTAFATNLALTTHFC